MRTLFANGRVLIDGSFSDRLNVLVEGDSIIAISDELSASDSDQIYDMNGSRLAPGFIDLQVNGGGGVLLNDAPTVDSIFRIVTAHSQLGTTSLLPTIISDDLDVVKATIRAVSRAIEDGMAGVIGVHLEGPFLSPDKKGAHDATKFQRLERCHIPLLSSLTNGKTLVTLAPEQTAPAMIRDLSDSGVVVAVGHSNASYDQTRQSIDAGISGFTHLFNAMSMISGRDPGVLGAALEDKETWCGIIADGFHVHPANLRLAFGAKPHSRFFLVSDAMPTVGAMDKTFELQGRTVTAQDGVCRLADGTLAGSDLDMLGAVRFCVSKLGLDLETALAMAATNPASFIGVNDQVGQIRTGYRADLVVLNDDLIIEDVWMRGTKK